MVWAKITLGLEDLHRHGYMVKHFVLHFMNGDVQIRMIIIIIITGINTCKVSGLWSSLKETNVDRQQEMRNLYWEDSLHFRPDPGV